MRITLLTIGSHGDIQPYVALAKVLIARGHAANVAGLSNGKDFVEKHSIPFRSLSGDVSEMMRLLVGVGVGPFEYFRSLDRLLASGKDQFLRDVSAVCEDADAIVYSLLGSVAYHIAEKKNIPCFRSFIYPLDPTTEFPALTAPRLPLGGLYNRFTYAAGDYFWSRLTTRHLNGWRQEMGLKPVPPYHFPYRAIQQAGSNVVCIQFPPSPKTEVVEGLSPHYRFLVPGGREVHTGRRPLAVFGEWFLSDLHRLWQHDGRFISRNAGCHCAKPCSNRNTRRSVFGLGKPGKRRPPAVPVQSRFYPARVAVSKGARCRPPRWIGFYRLGAARRTPDSGCAFRH